MGDRSVDSFTISASCKRSNCVTPRKRARRCGIICSRFVRILERIRQRRYRRIRRSFAVWRSMANLGFVGLGVMGSQMVNRLLSKGHAVTGYNRTRSKAQWLIDKGMKWANSPRAVAAAADVTFAMVTNSAAITSITEGPDGLLAGLSAGKIFVDISTVSPSVSRALAAKVREKGADMVDSPVSGSVITLQEGKLSVMVGGRRETFERVQPLLLDIGPKVTHVGDNGLALAMKIAINLSLAVQMMAFS